MLRSEYLPLVIIALILYCVWTYGVGIDLSEEEKKRIKEEENRLIGGLHSATHEFYRQQYYESQFRLRNK